MASTFTFEGATELNAGLREVGENGREGARKGLLFSLENVLTVASPRTPHEEGDLERDGQVSMDDNELRGAVAYGRTAQTAPYAVVQHENLSYHHDDGRTAKWLENAFNSTRTQSLQIMAAQIRRELGTE